MLSAPRSEPGRRPQDSQRFDLIASRPLGATIGEIDDLIRADTVDRGMGLFDKAIQPLREPMISARPFRRSCFAAPPTSLVGNDEPVQVKVEAVRAVDFGDERARFGERQAVKFDAACARS